MHCSSCDVETEEIVRSWRAEHFPPCETCGTKLQKADNPDNLKISSFSNYWAAGRTFVEGGEVFHSAAERAAYEEKHKIDGVHSKTSGHGKYLVDEARHQADVAAQDQGHKNHREYRKSKRREKQLKKGQLTSVDKRIQVG
jgi:hypothetical protein